MTASFQVTLPDTSPLSSTWEATAMGPFSPTRAVITLRHDLKTNERIGANFLLFHAPSPDLPAVNGKFYQCYRFSK